MTMDTVISLFVLSTLAQLVVPEVPSVTSFGAVVEMVSGDSRIFSEESVRLRCSVPDPHKSSWNYLWFRGSEQLAHSGEHFVLWKAKVKDSGKFYCQGVRDTVVGNIYTLKSLPVEINVDGGWAILQVPHHPGLVGHTLKVTCRVRGNPPIHEVILYKDGIEVMRQTGLNPHFYLINLTPKDQGMYSCRASWDIERRTRSVISADAQVQVLEVLSQPVLEIVTANSLIPAGKMKLICHLQYNAPNPAPPIHYYFYKNNNRLGTATSENHNLVRQSPGLYSCKAKVPQLGLSRWSELKTFGQVTGPQMLMPPSFHPRDQWPLAPPVSSSDLILLPAPEPAAAQPSPHRSTAAPPFIQPSEMSTQFSDPPLKHSQLTPSTLMYSVQFINQTATPTRAKPVTLSQETGEMSGDMPEESVDMTMESGGMPGKSPGIVIY
ncbi:high affinity immunoglobulin gamma Fc receptor I-like [Toxotes jaculatrix]|uniref:high affinity immunoglobulin gamma Fc receptor I-like n=1 Tax=Toxotes jaculatrix TaxID=941984 RepID=UPI001B3B0868|nr:high affinity immunoglobulin gamma Fc receptor I-like [Toxotes jaculatrix]